ncbi:hypothetical protein [Nannocystis punicea]|uniref:Uncharacterized protein n=1 Tax=Nannocystis punicea TaxID=2995304 RepID=A0ABY7HFC0_9BACT|nr:hypothetical protein [Nannocystis poenicansa]WAS97972.1 hypothetical protein O0S08_17670 [Nannocystis poenicansa]
MRSPALVASVLLLAVPACGPESPAPEPVGEAACPILAPTRLVAAPAGLEPAADARYDLHGFGDDLLFTFDRADDPDREYWHLNRCTGDLEPYPSLAPGLRDPYVINTAAGRVLYATDDDGRPFVLDRLDVPGADEARPVLGLPDSAFPQPVLPSSRHAPFYVTHRAQDAEHPVVIAAGLGGETSSLYVHDGDPEAPALKLSDTLIYQRRLDDSHILVHEDSGELHRVDLTTAERELLFDGARHVAFVSDRSLVWQAIGDDVAEPVYLHDLDTGEDLQIAVNDFAALSWNRGGLDDHDAGRWYASPGGVAAMLGPGGPFVVALRLDTREFVDIPPHRRVRGGFADHYRLTVGDGDENIEALWDPLTGSVREWYRGPVERTPVPYTLDGDRLDYFVRQVGDWNTGSLWRRDLATGEATELLTDIGSYPLPLDETLYLTRRLHSDLFVDLRLVDSATGSVTPIADRIADLRVFPDEGIVYLDVHGPDPGLWAYPLPFDR